MGYSKGGFRRSGIHESRGSGQECCVTGEIVDRRDSGMQDRWDARKEGFRR